MNWTGRWSAAAACIVTVLIYQVVYSSFVCCMTLLSEYNEYLMWPATITVKISTTCWLACWAIIIMLDSFHCSTVTAMSYDSVNIVFHKPLYKVWSYNETCKYVVGLVACCCIIDIRTSSISSSFSESSSFVMPCCAIGVQSNVQLFSS